MEEAIRLARSTTLSWVSQLGARADGTEVEVAVMARKEPMYLTCRITLTGVCLCLHLRRLRLCLLGRRRVVCTRRAGVDLMW